MIMAALDCPSSEKYILINFEKTALITVLQVDLLLFTRLVVCLFAQNYSLWIGPFKERKKM